MIFIKLENLGIVENLTKICEQYKEKTDIDVSHGRYTVDGCSVLGVTSLMGNIVKIELSNPDAVVNNEFFNKLKEIGAFDVSD